MHRDFSFWDGKKNTTMPCGSINRLKYVIMILYACAFTSLLQVLFVLQVFVGPWRLLQNAWSPCHWSLTKGKPFGNDCILMLKWERIYSEGPRVSNIQPIGFWKWIQLFLKHHVVLQNTHQNCMWAVLETFDVPLNWFDCFPDGFMNSKKMPKFRRIWRPSSTVGFHGWI